MAFYREFRMTANNLIVCVLCAFALLAGLAASLFTAHAEPRRPMSFMLVPEDWQLDKPRKVVVYATGYANAVEIGKRHMLDRYAVSLDRYCVTELQGVVLAEELVR